MKNHILLISLVALAFLSSCSIYKSNTSKTMDIYGAGVIHKPVLVDLDVKGSKVTGTSTSERGISLEAVKLNAVANALKNANADVLVEPIFETEISGGHTTATVTGWPATYKNFRSITAEDVPLLQVGVLQKAEVYESSKLSLKKSH